MTLVDQLRNEISLNDIVDSLGDLADRIEQEYLPRPKFEDGEYVQFGDFFISHNGEKYVVNSIEVNREGCFINGWMDEFYRSGERVKSERQADMLGAAKALNLLIDYVVSLYDTRAMRVITSALYDLMTSIENLRFDNLTSKNYDSLLNDVYETVRDHISDVRDGLIRDAKSRVEQ